jgi:3-methyladenine DNA glycosylase AlkD
MTTRSRPDLSGQRPLHEAPMHAPGADLAHLASALHARLEAAASPVTRAFWEAYMKGALPFRGVPMAGVRRAVQAWWRVDGPSELPEAAQKALALHLFEGAHGEDKLAGILALQGPLLDRLGLADLGPLAGLFDRGLVADWSTCDWLCLKVLHPMIARHLPDRGLADAVAAWRDAPNLWRRRAANVAFVTLAKRGDTHFPGFTRLMFDTCAVTVRWDARFAQTGVGWLLRELATSDQAGVLSFVNAHLPLMSREGLRYTLERMPKPLRADVLARHAASRRRP